jgi:hypothetical protein
MPLTAALYTRFILELLKAATRQEWEIPNLRAKPIQQFSLS